MISRRKTWLGFGMGVVAGTTATLAAPAGADPGATPAAPAPLILFAQAGGGEGGETVVPQSYVLPGQHRRVRLVQGNRGLRQGRAGELRGGARRGEEDAGGDRGVPRQALGGDARRGARGVDRGAAVVSRHRGVPLLRRPDRGGRRRDQLVADQRGVHRRRQGRAGLRHRQRPRHRDVAGDAAGEEPGQRRGRRDARLARHRVPAVGPGSLRDRSRQPSVHGLHRRAPATTTAGAPTSRPRPSGWSPTSAGWSSPGGRASPATTPRRSP